MVFVLTGMSDNLIAAQETARVRTNLSFPTCSFTHGSRSLHYMALLRFKLDYFNCSSDSSRVPKFVPENVERFDMLHA